MHTGVVRLLGGLRLREQESGRMGRRKGDVTSQTLPKSL